MSDHSTTVSTEFTGVEVIEAAEVSLVLEQKPFATDSGDIKSMDEIATENGWQFVRILDGGTAVSSDIDAITSAYYAQCGVGQDGSITATIYVFKNPSDLSYNLVATWGSFADDPITESTVKEESVSFNLEDSVDLRYDVESVESLEWEGDVYDVSGSVIHPDTPILEGTSLVTNQKVYGSARIKYKVFGDTWLLNIPRREDAESNEYQSTVLAFYGDNQVETLDVTLPNLTDLCNQSVEVCIGDCEEPAEDEPAPGSPEEMDGSMVALQLNAYDYCTGHSISGATFYIGGKQVPATGHTVRKGMTYSIVTKASGYKDFHNSFSV